MILKISPWLKYEIIELFVNTWAADYKYPVLDCENLPFPILKSSYIKDKKHSPNFLFGLWNLRQILNSLKKRRSS